MFIAKNAAGVRVELQTHKQAATLVGEAFTCPACGAPVRIKNGAQMPAHFAHIVGTCSASEPESQQHLLGKRWLRDWLIQSGEVAELEVYYPAIQQRADVVITSRKPALVLEFQCSPIAITDLARRTAGYHELGLAVIWIMGRRYFGRHLSAKQFKFMADDLTLWFLDSHQGRLSRHQWHKQGWTVTQFTKTWQRTATHQFEDAPLLEQRQLQNRLYYRDPKLLTLQALAYSQGRHLAGVPWLVHLAQTHLPGLPQAEWLMRTHWLLTFEHEAAFDDAAFWQQYHTASAPLRQQALILAAVRKRWLKVLQANGYLDRDSQWVRPLVWFADGEQKLAAWDQPHAKAQ